MRQLGCVVGCSTHVVHHQMCDGETIVSSIKKRTTEIKTGSWVYHVHNYMHDYYALYYETYSLNIACQTKPDFLCVLTSNLLLWQIKRMSNIYNVCIN